MLDNQIQYDLLTFYYEGWKDQPFRYHVMLKEYNANLKKPHDIRVLITNAQYLIDKGLMAPPMTFGFHTRITLEGVLFVESTRYSKDVPLRTKILSIIQEEYEKKTDWVNIYEIQEELKLARNEIHRNIQMLEHLGLIKTRRVLGGYSGASITAQGFDFLKKRSIVDYEISIMSKSYSDLYRLENNLREFLETTLREYYGDNWWEDGIPTKLKEVIIDNKEKSNGIGRNMKYTNFIHLRRIIIKSENWKNIYVQIFKKQGGIIGRLEELEPIRHNIAHTRMLTNDEIMKIELFTREISGMIS